ncbi:MAG: glutamate decarboxylase, partial [Lachnospiraceae bacterium]|nr:glutamate decarboxylase [Lachnospiraceae bacterium]
MTEENHEYLDSRFGSYFSDRIIDENFPKEEMRDDIAYQIISDELLLDGNARQNLATFCQTYDDDYVRKLMNLSIDKNWIDKEEYRESSMINERCVNMMADLWNAPKTSGKATGTNTIGSSEACMLGGMAMKWRWREKMKAQGKDTSHPNIVTGPVQVCWHKFAKYWDVELREMPMEPGRVGMTPEQMLTAVDENTIGVVVTFGVTYTGEYEFPKDFSDALDKYEEETGIDIPIHVDAASGGFLAPFVAPDIEWDFRLPRVKSINASGHKYGLAPLGCGWVLWREEKDLPKDLIFNVDYLGGSIGTFAINFSRSAGPIISQYYEFLRLGKEGYRKVQQSAYNVAKYIKTEIGNMGPYTFFHDGDEHKGIPALCFKISDDASCTYNLYDLSECLRLRGWQVPAFALNPDISDTVVMRIMCRRGFEMEFAHLFVKDFKYAVEYLKDHPAIHGQAPK